MSESMLFSALVIFLHDLFTVLWIGGIIFMSLVLMPVLRTARAAAGSPDAGVVRRPEGGPGANRDGPFAVLTKKVQSRLAAVSLVSLVGLVVTGLLLTRRSGTAGILRFDTAYAAVLSVKHLLVVTLVVLSLVRRRLVARGGRSAAILLTASTGVSIAILALSAVNAAMA